MDLQVRRIYGSLTPGSSLPKPLGQLQEVLVNSIIYDDHFNLYPPSTAYQRSFWKYILQELEASNEDIDDHIYERYAKLLEDNASDQSRFMTGPPSPSYVTHFLELPSDPTETPRPITLLESRTTIEAGTTGMRTWRASLLLAEWLLQNPAIIEGKRVLELGSGVGFLGVLVSHIQRAAINPDIQGPQPYLCLTDVNENVLSRCRNNLNLPCNLYEGIQASDDVVEVRKLNWFDALSDDPIARDNIIHTLKTINPDTILGADIVYDTRLVPALVETIRTALESSHQEGSQVRVRLVWIALSVRIENTASTFIRATRDKGLEIAEQAWNLPSTRKFLGVWEGEAEDVKLFRIVLPRIDI